MEAKVINQQPFVNEDGYIYTKNSLEVYKSFTDGIDIENFDIITLGGEIPDLVHRWSHSFNIARNESAIFFLKRSALFPDTYIPFNSTHGIIRFRTYDKNDPMIIHQSGHYSNIQREVYDKLKGVTGTLNFVKLNDYEKSQISTNLLNINSTNCVEYSIRNVEIIQNNSLVSSSSFYLNFDIAIRSKDESFNLHSTEIAMAYSTSLFGKNDNSF